MGHLPHSPVEKVSGEKGTNGGGTDQSSPPSVDTEGTEGVSIWMDHVGRHKEVIVIVNYNSIRLQS